MKFKTAHIELPYATIIISNGFEKNSMKSLDDLPMGEIQISNDYEGYGRKVPLWINLQPGKENIANFDQDKVRETIAEQLHDHILGADFLNPNDADVTRLAGVPSFHARIKVEAPTRQQRDEIVNAKPNYTEDQILGQHWVNTVGLKLADQTIKGIERVTSDVKRKTEVIFNTSPDKIVPIATLELATLAGHAKAEVFVGGVPDGDNRSISQVILGVLAKQVGGCKCEKHTANIVFKRHEVMFTARMETSYAKAEEWFDHGAIGHLINEQLDLALGAINARFGTPVTN